MKQVKYVKLGSQIATILNVGYHKQQLLTPRTNTPTICEAR
jgi:hypothetical protein